MSEYRLIPLRGKYGEGKFAKVSPEDYDWLSVFKWRSCPEGYVIRTASTAEKRDGKAHTVFMHREIAGVPKGFDTDHKNRDRLDNQPDNLRPATKSQNGQNVKAHIRATSSTYRGVCLCKKTGRWIASASYRGKVTYIGHFDTEEEAARAVDSVGLFLNGEFFRPNFPDAVAKPLSLVKPRKKRGEYTSVYRGVSRNGHGWSAKLNGSGYGTFPTQETAALAYDDARAAHGLPRVNFP